MRPRPRVLVAPLLVSLFLGCTAALAGCGERDEPGQAEVERERPESASGATDAGEEPADLVSAQAEAAFGELRGGAEGPIGVAVAPLGEADPVELGDLPSGRAWSTMKVVVLVALIDRLGGTERLSGAERAAAEAALTRSDNAAALDLFTRLQELEGGLGGANRAIEDVLRTAGDGETTVNTEPSPEGYSTFGQTDWSAAGATRFFGALAGGCLLSADDTAYVLDLMGAVVPEQRWGLGEAGFSAETELAFKGGWGPEDDGPYLVRQSGIVTTPGEGAYAISIIALPSGEDRSFEAGQRIVTATAEWARAELAGAPDRGCG